MNSEFHCFINRDSSSLAKKLKLEILKLTKQSLQPREVLVEIPIGLDLTEDSETEDELPLSVVKYKSLQAKVTESLVAVDEGSSGVMAEAHPALHDAAATRHVAVDKGSSGTSDEAHPALHNAAATRQVAVDKGSSGTSDQAHPTLHDAAATGHEDSCPQPAIALADENNSELLGKINITLSHPCTADLL